MGLLKIGSKCVEMPAANMRPHCTPSYSQLIFLFFSQTDFKTEF